ncbi:MAG: RNA polymerase sigma factor [Planctomycetota bacterium]|jgi:RNA polymerase sigma factor (sigma-70 family)
MLCQELFYQYCMDFSDESFERFYYLTIPVFLSFAAERCQEMGNQADPQEVVNRLYGILVSHASHHRRIPIRVLFSWCFGVITNLIREEHRLRERKFRRLEACADRVGGMNPLESIIRSEETRARQAVYRGILHLIKQPNAVLVERERRVMALFYFGGMAIKGIAALLDITPEHTGVILFRARRRLAEHFQGRAGTEGIPKRAPVRRRYNFRN